MMKSLMSGSIASFIVSFVSMIFLARSFELEFVSDVKSASLYGGLISTICSLQLHSAFLYFFNRYPNEKVEASSYLAFFTASVLSGIVFFVLFPNVYQSGQLNQFGLFFLSIGVSCSTLFIMSPSVFAALGDHNKLPFFMFCFPSVTLLALGVSYYIELDINDFAVVQSSMFLMVVLASKWGVYLKRLFGSTATEMVPNRSLVIYASKLSASNLIESFADKLDKLWVSSTKSQPEFAKYAVLSFENPIASILLSSYGITLVKTFSNSVNLATRAFAEAWRDAIGAITFVTYPITAIILFNADWIVGWIFGQQYVEASHVFMIYAFTTLVRPAPFQALLKIRGLAHYNITIALVFFVIASVLGYILHINEASYDYFAYCYLFGWLGFNLTAIVLFSRETKVSIRSIMALDIIFGRIVLSFPLAYIIFQSLSLNMFLSFICYAASYVSISLILDKKVRRYPLIRRIFRKHCD